MHAAAVSLLQQLWTAQQGVIDSKQEDVKEALMQVCGIAFFVTSTCRGQAALCSPLDMPYNVSIKAEHKLL